MRKALFVCLIAMLALPLLAQDAPKAEVFGGYQYFRLNPGHSVSGVNFNGWNAALTGYVKPNVGLTVDMSGAYKSESGASMHFHNFMFGPTFTTSKSETVKPFVHALFGVSHVNAGFDGLGGSDNAFAMALGGGVDANISHNIALRIIQADYFMTRFASESQHNVRISTGIVFRF